MKVGLRPTKPATAHVSTAQDTLKGRPPTQEKPASAGAVGATGFEPATSSSRTKRATGLRYAPKFILTKNVNLP